jgi:hypothetical protein
MATFHGFWPLNLSVESLVLREMVPIRTALMSQKTGTGLRASASRLLGCGWCVCSAPSDHPVS